MEETANNLVQAAKDSNGAVYRKIFSLSAENQRLSIENRDLKNQNSDLIQGKAESYDFRKMESEIKKLQKENDLKRDIIERYQRAGYIIDKPMENTTLGHFAALGKAARIAEEFLPRIFWATPEMTKAKDIIYNILRNE